MDTPVVTLHHPFLRLKEGLIKGSAPQPPAPQPRPPTPVKHKLSASSRLDLPVGPF